MRILYVDIDTLRPDHLGCYGYPRATSTNIDKVAEDSVRFTDVYCSDAPCLPSRAALMTGRFGIHTGCVGHGGVNAEMRWEGRNRGMADFNGRYNLPAVLRRAGMKTASISSFPDRHAAWWFNGGFDETYNIGKRGLEPAHEVIPVALDWLDRKRDTKDWFLHVHVWDPHIPYRTPTEYGEPFKDAPLPDPWMTQEILDKHRATKPGGHSACEVTGYDNKPNPATPRQPVEIKNTDDFRHMIDEYDTGIWYADKQLGLLFDKLREQGIEITPANLKISDRATITMPYHVEQDGLEEARLSKTGAQFGSTKRGIAYAYGDKYMKKTLRMGDLLHLDDAVKKRLVTMVDSKNLVMEGSYNAAPISVDEMWAWLEKYAAIFKDYICDVGQYLADADAAGKKVLFEAQLGALRDIDFGIYPYTTSSNVIGAYAPIGAGIPGHKLHNSIGVMKAYSSCVGDGPFAAELAMTEEEKHALREAGHEYGAATGRPRRVGPIDLVASRYGVFCQGCDEVALTLLDVLDYMEKIPMVTAYKLTDGTTTTRFPMGEALDTAQPVVEYLPGWHCDITAARKWEDLPQQARDYVEYLEKAVGCKITYISVGAEREAYIHRG